MVLKRTKHTVVPPTLIALDPGETTGAAVFRNGLFQDSDQIPLSQIPQPYSVTQSGIPEVITWLHSVYQTQGISVIVAEDFLLYPHKAKDQSWNPMLTPRLLGAIELFCIDHHIHLVLQNAQQGKSFASDTKLRAWNMFNPARRHANDACRHGVDWLIFGSPLPTLTPTPG